MAAESQRDAHHLLQRGGEAQDAGGLHVDGEDVRAKVMTSRIMRDALHTNIN
jgi:hypothetical protein